MSRFAWILSGGFSHHRFTTKEIEKSIPLSSSYFSDNKVWLDRPQMIRLPYPVIALSSVVLGVYARHLATRSASHSRVVSGLTLDGNVLGRSGHLSSAILMLSREVSLEQLDVSFMRHNRLQRLDAPCSRLICLYISRSIVGLGSCGHLLGLICCRRISGMKLTSNMDTHIYEIMACVVAFPRRLAQPSLAYFTRKHQLLLAARSQSAAGAGESDYFIAFQPALPAMYAICPNRCNCSARSSKR